MTHSTTDTAGTPSSSPRPPSNEMGFTTVFIIVVVLAFFSALAIWGVAAATIVAVSAAVVPVLRAILPPRH